MEGFNGVSECTLISQINALIPQTYTSIGFLTIAIKLLLCCIPYYPFMKILLFVTLFLYTIGCYAQTRFYPYYDGHLWGLTNKHRDIVVTPRFDTSFLFYNDHFAVARKDHLYGTIDTNGITLINFEYEQIGFGYHGFGLGQKKGKYVLLNLQDGKVVSPEAYDDVSAYCVCSEKLFVVTKGGKKWLVSGITGRQQGKTGYDDLRFTEYFNSRAFAKTGGKYGVINTQTHDWVIQPKYDTMSTTYHNSQQVFAAVVRGRTVYLDGNGKKPKKEEPEEEWAIMNERGPITTDTKKDLYVYDQGNNNWKLNIESRSNNDKQVYQTYNLNGYTGVEKLAYWEWGNQQATGVVKAIKDGRTGLVNMQGIVLLPFQYDSIDPLPAPAFQGRYYTITIGDKVGVLNNGFSQLIRPVLKRVLNEEPSLEALLVEMPGGQQGYLSTRTGTVYIPNVRD
jgi:hypothetical protein